jgi:hypothetical protein
MCIVKNRQKSIFVTKKSNYFKSKRRHVNATNVDLLMLLFKRSTFSLGHHTFVSLLQQVVGSNPDRPAVLVSSKRCAMFVRVFGSLEK